LNCRKIDETYNFFEGITKNTVYIFIWCFIVVVQILLGQYGGVFFSCYRFGLSGPQWGVCIGLGATGLIVNIFGKTLVFYVLKLGDGEIDLTEHDDDE